MAQLVKNPPAMWETWVQSLGWEDPLEKGKATDSSILAWRLPWTVNSPWGCKESDTTERLSLSFLRKSVCVCVCMIALEKMTCYFYPSDFGLLSLSLGTGIIYLRVLFHVAVFIVFSSPVGISLLFFLPSPQFQGKKKKTKTPMIFSSASFPPEQVAVVDRSSRGCFQDSGKSN